MKVELIFITTYKEKPLCLNLTFITATCLRTNMKAIIMLSLLVLAGCAQEAVKMDTEGLEVATFAGGCFWCVESAFDKLPDVEEAVSGYTGGDVENPTYEQVSAGKTGHFEAVQVLYDPNKVTYRELVEHFFRQIDPTDDGGQFADRGSQYRTAIFYHNEEQKKIAEEVIMEIDESGRFDEPVVTEVRPAEDFYVAESYHQDYAKKNPFRYKTYKKLSGREGFIDENWK